MPFHLEKSSHAECRQLTTCVHKMFPIEIIHFYCDHNNQTTTNKEAIWLYAELFLGISKFVVV